MAGGITRYPIQFPIQVSSASTGKAQQSGVGPKGKSIKSTLTRFRKDTTDWGKHSQPKSNSYGEKLRKDPNHRTEGMREHRLGFFPHFPTQTRILLWNRFPHGR